MATATLIDDNGQLGEPEHMEELDTGWYGRRDYLVNTRVLEVAMAATGLPTIGDPWSQTRTDLRVRRRSRLRTGGKLDNPVSAGGQGGWCVIRVEYETPGLRGRTPAPEVGQAYTELSFDPQTVTAYKDVDDSIEVLANGDGAPVEVVVPEAIVHTYVDPADYDEVLDAILAAAAGPVNENEIKLPPVYGAAGTYTLEPGQARLRGVQFATRYGKLEVIYRIAIADHHWFVWDMLDATGNAVATILSIVYQESEWGELWPGIT